VEVARLRGPNECLAENSAMSNPESFDDIEEEFDGALALRDTGKVDEALRILQDLALRRPDAYPVFGAMAGIQYEKDDLEGASRNFRRTVVLSPRSELASRGLFHSLYKLGKLAEAFEEVARYRALKSSAEYDLILKELLAESEETLRDDEGDEFFREVIDRVGEELRVRPMQTPADP
jgi:predicted Zn-dependent protease